MQRNIPITRAWLARSSKFDGGGGFNAETHLKSIMGGIQCSFPIEDGKVVRGSRQTIYFMEYDGPLERTYMVQVLGE